MKLMSVNIGKEKTYDFDGFIIKSGLEKSPVFDNVFIHKLGVTGDEQAEKVVHGGVDKAVCLYPFEHYEYWENTLNRKMPENSFGENLTVQGMTEKDVCIGDIFQIGEVVLQITQPRQPCYKLTYIHNVPKMSFLSQDSGFTGYYARVLKEGNLNVNDKITLIEKSPHNISVEFTNQILHNDNKNTEAIKKILEVKEIAANLRKNFEKLLAGETIDPRPRLTGL
ncbi:MOSC domain-containing protein [Sebaldella sp. S0638]|uniref:MOSC domain-containing protein n=1 Tax=Sebaldella sp. S0638 TaxID=2957809 RepID=UPI00209F6FD1|nr:MOSC domain-containing protein [Sebaldella sp. S0638]MCP1224215.1 MOSC domain-containing protein [Sebaldella sp. S0638]